MRSINNGVIFPACNKCRQAGLKKLGLQFKKDRKKNDEAMENAVEEEAKVEEEVCTECSNWDLLNKDVDLSSLQHQDYPLEITQGSPVDPPKGRDTFGEGTRLSFMEITWENMRNACKFAFFQASRPTKSWNQEKDVVLLESMWSGSKHCRGVLQNGGSC